jgi:hypothetical protein
MGEDTTPGWHYALIDRRPAERLFSALVRMARQALGWRRKRSIADELGELAKAGQRKRATHAKSLNSTRR